ncbi:3-isopropylmalate dehydratase small subunit [Altererythrobacter lutimaris]|uniref:3-isopropylmalate dehydratase small subunit n=1 Tax=Altererythrobacter lutimaris TaxID=2743979 RepID=A0A850H921_9SPHN|nr:3-isopropylmalate dehydratase small subunit [Altererythrobacter lutimaris]NVE93396.1 3-isopropylmalate dehydratase small subunit [Altererythrobacter lutimaris]
MDAVSTIAGKAYPFGAKNVDTDVIISAEWLKTITREGLGKGAFESVRAQDGNVFDDPRYSGSPILIAGDNFGCGSSREHAAWAIKDMGIKAVIAPSFSDIFSGNAFKNGILTVAIPQEQIDRLMEVASEEQEITVDLDSQTVTTLYQDRFEFEVDPFRKHCLMNGLDEVGITLQSDATIGQFESKRAGAMPWIAHGTNIAA